MDLGFSSFIDPPALKGGSFQEKDIVEARSKNELKKLPHATKADLYTYKAYVERVVDADTLWLRINLGFNFWVRQKVRLRGIDAPELDTKAGLAAKRFVEKKLADAPFVIVTTTKPDKFDRYLTDVWISDSVNLNKLLLESGHARLKTDFSGDNWDLDSWGRF